MGGHVLICICMLKRICMCICIQCLYVCMNVCVYACTYMYHVGMHARNVQETRSNMFSESCLSILYSFLVDSQQQQKNPYSSTFQSCQIFILSYIYIYKYIQVTKGKQSNT